MDEINKRIPRIVKRTEYYPEGANTTTLLTVHKCFCFFGKGRIEHHRVPGFNDEWFEIKCKKCEKKYEPYIDQIGDEWILYPFTESKDDDED